MTPVRIRTRQTGVCALSTALLVSAATAQPVSDLPLPSLSLPSLSLPSLSLPSLSLPGHAAPRSAEKKKTVSGRPPTLRVLPLGVPAAALNDHLERIPKCYIVGGMRQLGPGRFEYVDTTGQVIPDLSVPFPPKTTLVCVPKTAVKPSEESAQSRGTR